MVWINLFISVMFLLHGYLYFLDNTLFAPCNLQEHFWTFGPNQCIIYEFLQTIWFTLLPNHIFWNHVSLVCDQNDIEVYSTHGRYRMGKSIDFFQYFVKFIASLCDVGKRKKNPKLHNSSYRRLSWLETGPNRRISYNKVKQGLLKEWTEYSILRFNYSHIMC